MQTHLVHASIVALISFFLLALADLIPFWMPMMGEMLTLLVATILLMIWVSFVISEKAIDEREMQLKIQSGRVAYLAGIGTLMLALVVQGFAHAIDPWIPVVLVVMVFTKFLTRVYLE